ncbi:MAG: HK97 family phage prohead protease [Clostridiales bacterium]|nr:HK97 family phage prohead protease [Clostridiales bacterium]
MPMKTDREYRSMELRAVPQGESKDYIVEGYATTFGDTYELFRDGNYVVMENVDRDAFKNTDMSDVIFQIDHEGRVYARNRNGSLNLKVDEHGLKTRANLGLTESSRSVYEDIDAGLYDRMSFAFTVTKDSYTEEEREDGTVVLTRTILSVGKLYDVSAVSFPANPNTDISARSKDAIDGEIKRFEAERLHEQKITEMRNSIKEQISRITEVKANE